LLKQTATAPLTWRTTRQSRYSRRTQICLGARGGRRRRMQVELRSGRAANGANPTNLGKAEVGTCGLGNKWPNVTPSMAEMLKPRQLKPRGGRNLAPWRRLHPHRCHIRLHCVCQLRLYRVWYARRHRGCHRRRGLLHLPPDLHGRDRVVLQLRGQSLHGVRACMAYENLFLETETVM
jgi:hypothetical protein